MVVENHKAGININRFAVFVNCYCVGVAAGIIVLLVKCKVIMLVQKMAAAHSGNPGAYYRGAPPLVSGGIIIGIIHQYLFRFNHLLIAPPSGGWGAYGM